MTPLKHIPITDLDVGDMLTTSDSALAVTAVTPGPLSSGGSPGVRVDLDNGAHVWFPVECTVTIRDVAVIS